MMMTINGVMFLFGQKEVLKLNYDDSCTTVDILKLIELYILTGELYDMQIILLKLSHKMSITD